MSDRLKSTNSVSNEDVIEDLTKNLEFSLRAGDTQEKENPDLKPKDFNATGDRDPTKSDFADIQFDAEDADTEAQQNSDKDDNDDSDTDSIDEVSLKDTEMSLTDDQKEERKIISEELKVAGNEAFKVGDMERSIEKYTEGLNICPLQFPKQRAILYCNRSAAKMKLEKHKHAIKDCTKAIELDENYLKAYHRRAQSYEATDKLDESLADYKKVLELDPSHAAARAAVIRLPPMIEERNEKLKTEMLGKLKDLGNMILRPFGLSTENFQLQQDPDTKGYKINFKQ